MLSASARLVRIMDSLDKARWEVLRPYGGGDPGYPSPDSVDAMAWDYLDAIDEARRAIGYRLNTWNGGDYDE